MAVFVANQRPIVVSLRAVVSLGFGLRSLSPPCPAGQKSLPAFFQPNILYWDFRWDLLSAAQPPHNDNVIRGGFHVLETDASRRRPLRCRRVRVYFGIADFEVPPADGQHVGRHRVHP